MGIPFVTSVTFGARGVQITRRAHFVAVILRSGLLVRGWEIVSSVRGFGNEGVVLNQGPVDYGFRPVDSELDKR